MSFSRKMLEVLLCPLRHPQSLKVSHWWGLGLRCDKVTPAQKVPGD